MVLAAFNGTGYKILLLLHILSVIVAFAPNFVWPFVSVRLRAANKSTGATINELSAGGTLKIYGPAFFLAGFFGCGLVGMSEKLYTFSQTWISIALLLWFVGLGVMFGLIAPAEKKAQAGDEGAAAGLEVLELGLHRGQAGLELLDRLVLLGESRLGPRDLALVLDLTAQRHAREVVELERAVRVALAAQLLRLMGSSSRLAAPLCHGVPIGLQVGFGHPHVGDRLGDRLLRLGDGVGVVADELVQHLLRVLRAVQEGVDVGACELADAAEDGLLLGHVIDPSGVVVLGRAGQSVVLVSLCWCLVVLVAHAAPIRIDRR